MKVLVTGATGFIGSYILRYLLNREDVDVVGLCRPTSSFAQIADIRDLIEWRKADIRDLPELNESMKGVDIVINASGAISHSYKDLIEINVEGTANLVNLALHNGVKRFIHISSTAALGGARNRLINETDLWPDKPLKFNYGWTKYLAEQEVWRAGEEGLSVAIINPPMVIGAGDWHLFPSFIKTIYNGLKWYPSGSIGVVDVRDIAKMCLQLAFTESVSNERYICSSENWALKDISRSVAQNLGIQGPVKELKDSHISMMKWILPIVQLMGFYKEIPIEFAEYAQHQLSYDNTKSIKQLKFSYIPVKPAIEDTILSFLDTFPKGVNVGVLPIIN